MRARNFGWLAIMLVAWPLLGATPLPPQRFASPESAVAALVATVRGDGPSNLEALFGREGLDIVKSGDPVADQTLRQQFITAYDVKHSIDTTGDTATLSIGKDDWPFPIPLKHTPRGWSFDVVAGREEILDRRIGANELYVQQVVLAYVDAQNEYAQSLHDGIKLHVYAQHLLSTPGQQDGLFWDTAEGQPLSPIGLLVAEARAGGYRPGKTVEQQPYHGYYFRILTAQGPHAAGGAYDYIENGLMIGGFGLVAWPATWGNSGVMTFIVNQDGELFESNLGPHTSRIASAMVSFDPDDMWQKLGVPAPSPGAASN